MEKKINSFIKRIEVKESLLDTLNQLIEEKCLNSGVLILVDFLTYKNYSLKFEEIKKSSLNNIEILPLNFNEYNEKGESKISKIFNETFSFVVGIGELGILNFAKRFAIKTNICYGLVSLNGLQSEIFCNNLDPRIQNFKYFPPYFVMVNEKLLTQEEKFNLKLNIFKYCYLFLEYNLAINKNEKLKEFLIQYKNILANLNDENLVSSVIALGLILNKYEITFFTSFYCDFMAFLKCGILLEIYGIIFKKLNENNLYFSRIYKNSIENIISFQNFDFNFNKFYLLSLKNKAIKHIKTIKNLYVSFCDILKNTSLKSFYIKANYINSSKVLNEIINSKNTLFLNFMKNFELFNI